MILGKWRFQETATIRLGNVVTCTTNAPGGTFWGGNQRQPVLKAHAHVREAWFGVSISSLEITATAPLQVGPEASELIELEGVLYGKRVLKALPGRVSAVGFASIFDSKGIERAAIAVHCKPFILAAVKSERVHDTRKTQVCLSPDEKYTVEGRLSVEALISKGIGGDPAEAEFMNDDGTGLPAGLMLIILPRGTC